MTVLYVATGNHVVRLTRSNDDEWQSRIMLEDRGVQSITVDPHDPMRLFAGTFDHGLFRSLDGGKNWVQISPGIPHDRIPSVAISPSRSVDGINAVYAGTEPSSLYLSEDNGPTWQDMPALRELPSAPTWSFPPRPWTSHVRWIAPSWHDPELIFPGSNSAGSCGAPTAERRGKTGNPARIMTPTVFRPTRPILRASTKLPEEASR